MFKIVQVLDTDYPTSDNREKLLSEMTGRWLDDQKIGPANGAYFNCPNAWTLPSGNHCRK